MTTFYSGLERIVAHAFQQKLFYHALDAFANVDLPMQIVSEVWHLSIIMILDTEVQLTIT